MAELAIKPMTLDEFLAWEDGTDTRYELIGGFPVAMAPPARAHGILCARLAGMIDIVLRSRRPCTVQSEAGIARSDRKLLHRGSGCDLPAISKRGTTSSRSAFNCRGVIPRDRAT